MFGLTPYNRRNSGIERAARDLFDFGRVFENFFSDSSFPAIYNGSGQMKVDIRDDEKEYVIEADLPGIQKDEINIDFNDGRLTISAEKKEEKSEERENYIRRERRYGSISRTFLVENVKEDEIAAKFENGVLTLKIPKKESEVAKNRKIEIK